LLQEAVEKRGGACAECPLRRGELLIQFPSSSQVTRMTGDNARVRVVCGALGGQTVRTEKVPEPVQCRHFKRRERRMERRRQDKRKLATLTVADLALE
jgi:hypothetical protein